MPFDLACFAQDLLSLRKPQDILDAACRAASDVCGAAAFAAHVLPGRDWQTATLSPSQVPAASLAAIRSALHALHRRASLETGLIHIDRSQGPAPVFRALWPEGIDRLALAPLRHRGGRIGGVLAVGTSAETTQDRLKALETIASLTGAAMDACGLQAAAQRDQERLLLFSETTEESLWDWNLATNELWWGGNVEQLFGGIARGAMRPTWRDARVHPDDRDCVSEAFTAALRSRMSSWNAEYRLLGREGASTHVREHVYFLREPNGNAHRAIGTVRDISALKLLLMRETDARAEAERASGVKDEFLAMLGHELRNPLAPIVSVLSILERRAAGPDRQLQILRRQTQHLVRLVDDLLDVSRISSGKVELSPEFIDLLPLVHRALEMVHPLMEQRRHEVDLNLDEPLPVHVDGARLTQVFTNLLNNAAKYSEPGGHVSVTGWVEGGEAVVAVRDRGIGISAPALPFIFDSFTQGRQALDRSGGGLGLGLSIVKNIVRLHGGTVEAHSEGPGSGTTVTVRLPLASPPVVASFGLIAPAPLSSGSHDILVIDDNEDASVLLAELLTEQGHQVRIAHHPDEALRLFAEQAPQVALVDIGLPSMDGYELARRLRASSGGHAAALVALTGYGSAADRDRALAAGFDDHVVKPVSPERLGALMGRVVEARGASRVNPPAQSA